MSRDLHRTSIGVTEFVTIASRPDLGHRPASSVADDKGDQQQRCGTGFRDICSIDTAVGIAAGAVDESRCDDEALAAQTGEEGFSGHADAGEGEGELRRFAGEDRRRVDAGAGGDLEFKRAETVGVLIGIETPPGGQAQRREAGDFIRSIEQHFADAVGIGRGGVIGDGEQQRVAGDFKLQRRQQHRGVSAAGGLGAQLDDCRVGGRRQKHRQTKTQRAERDGRSTGGSIAGHALSLYEQVVGYRYFPQRHKRVQPRLFSKHRHPSRSQRTL